MWDVGNEVILTTQDHYTGAQIEAERIAYAQYVDQVAQAIHAADPNHPVTSTDAYTGAWPYYKQYTPSLDLMAVNSYGAVCNVKQDWINGGYTKPYILTEGGPSGEWEVPNDANGVPTEPSDPQKARRVHQLLELPDEPHRASRWAAPGSTTASRTTSVASGSTPSPAAGGGSATTRSTQMFGGNAGTNTPPVISSDDRRAERGGRLDRSRSASPCPTRTATPSTTT